MITPSNGGGDAGARELGVQQGHLGVGLGDLGAGDVDLGARPGGQRLVQLQLVLLPGGHPAQPLQAEFGVVEGGQQVARAHNLAGTGIFAADIAVEAGGDGAADLALDHALGVDVVFGVEGGKEQHNSSNGHGSQLQHEVFRTDQLSRCACRDVEGDRGQPALGLVQLAEG